MTDAATLAGTHLASVAAAAGCGKTYLISEAVCRYGTRRDLVLTHTHAGVDAICRKIQSLRNGGSSYVVDTIAAWVLRYVSAFPMTSGLQNPVPKTKEEWRSLYGTAAALLRRGALRDILRASYSGVYVDEYQDCTVQQHELVLAIAETLPTRVLGDPLQGIFDFGQNQPVDWDRDVRPRFTELPSLTRPWRWERPGQNLDLGRWLIAIRQDLLQRRPVNLAQSPVRWERLLGDNQVVRQVSVLLEIARQPGTVVAIHGVARQCHFVASKLKGIYQCVEPIEAPDLIAGARAIQAAHGPTRTAAVIDFASKCMTQVGTALRRVRDQYRAGAIPQTRQGRLSAVHDALRRIAGADSFTPVVAALKLLPTIPKAVVYRRELLTEMIQGLRNATAGGVLEDALWAVRNRTRFAGRQLWHCSIGTTLLVKGLEFDHVVIMDADSMDVKDLYVALTRGSRSLTIFSRGQTISPR